METIRKSLQGDPSSSHRIEGALVLRLKGARSVRHLLEALGDHCDGPGGRWQSRKRSKGREADAGGAVRMIRIRRESGELFGQRRHHVHEFNTRADDQFLRIRL